MRKIMMRVMSFIDLITRVKREAGLLYNPQFDGFIFTMFDDYENEYTD